jgi:hypothetical protein
VQSIIDSISFYFRVCRIIKYIFDFLNIWSSHTFLVFDMCVRYQKFFFRVNYKADQIDQNLVSLLSIRQKLIVLYCVKVDYVLKLLKCCTSSNFSFCTLVNKLRYIKLEASKDDQLWDSTVQSVLIWLIKAKRNFDQLDQLYDFHKEFFLMRAHAEYKRYARAKFFFFDSKVAF